MDWKILEVFTCQQTVMLNEKMVKIPFKSLYFLSIYKAPKSLNVKKKLRVFKNIDKHSIGP